ncbi:MAG: DUF4382 domain-containing protein [Candidatus Aenigmatarchaeota archaeon]
MKYLVLLTLCLMALSGCIAPANAGTLQLKVTDAGNISSLVLSISQIEVHMASNDMNETESGWITVNGAKSIDLIQVKGINEILGNTTLSEGKYTQIRLSVSSATAVIDGQSYSVTVPSGKFKFVHNFDIVANKTTSLILDFNADSSIVTAGDKYVLKPVVQVITEFTGE